ncbi:MAG: hypothetical protein U5R14_01390 [Gemmatimonadota bacterium]|nr:hypothetical protein [Gemmatimonadota bacterium]
MLNRDRLIDLYRTHRDQNVLSVYVDGDGHDPAERRAWALELEQGLAKERARLEAEAPAEVAAFDRARAQVEDRLGRFGAFLPAKGWVGFATPDELAYAEEVPVPMPHLVRWEKGLRAAPYVRALKQDRTVVAALVDNRKARVFTYRGGELRERADLLADADIGDYGEAGMSKRAATHSGARGETGTDAAHRALEVSASRLHGRLIEVVRDLAGSDGFVVLGGTKEAESAVEHQLAGLSDRLSTEPSLHLAMSDAEVRAVVERAASEVSARRQGELLQAVFDQARSGGKGSLGIEATEDALRGARVETLLLTRAFREAHPDLADHFVGTAFEQGAAVEELAEESADRLDDEAEGVAARLRFTR